MLRGACATLQSSPVLASTYSYLLAASTEDSFKSNASSSGEELPTTSKAPPPKATLPRVPSTYSYILADATAGRASVDV